jgi:mannose-6-phosphate isomerase
MRPAFVEKLWGGSRLAFLPAKRRPGHAPPSDVAVGESWEVADLEGGQSVVDNDPVCAAYAGRTLRSLVEELGVDLVGEGFDPARFPILVKLIDAGEDLSVQVHPGADYAARHPGVASKEEAWYVVDAADDAIVRHGLIEGMDRELFGVAVRKAHDGHAYRYLRSVKVRPGQVIHVGPGVVHGIGAGNLILEVQEPSDTTFRLYDYDRVDQSGKKRALHIDQGLAVAHVVPIGQDLPHALARPRPLGGRRTSLLDTPRFSMHAVDLDARGVVVGVDRAVVVYAAGAVDGSGAVGGFVDVDVEGAAVRVVAGGTCVVPACARGAVLSGQGRAILMYANRPGEFDFTA